MAIISASINFDFINLFKYPVKVKNVYSIQNFDSLKLQEKKGL